MVDCSIANCLPIEIIWTVISLIIIVPIVALMVDRTSNRIILMLSLWMAGSMWILFFAFMDGIITGNHIENTIINGTQTTYTYENDVYDLQDENGDYSQNKLYIIMLGVIWVAMAIVVEPHIGGRFIK